MATKHRVTKADDPIVQSAA